MLTSSLTNLFLSYIHIIIPSVIIVSLGIFAQRIFFPWRKAQVHGFCTPEFETVRDIFRSNFDKGWEEEGASFAVYHKGRLVVDLWGGFMEKKCYRVWKKDTMTCLFSLTKSVGALCLALLVDRGLCNYDDKISKFWPEYAKNGKEDTTIAMVLEHRTGLPYFDRNVIKEDLDDPARMRKLIEDEKPKYKIGTNIAYHALTYGWILDSLFQSIDPNKRNVGQFIKEELHKKHNLDIHMGNCPVEEFRVARLAKPSFWLMFWEFLSYPISMLRSLIMVALSGGTAMRAFRNIAPFGVALFSDNNPYIGSNNADFRQWSQPAFNGIGTARALAELYVKAFEGGLLSKELVEIFKEPTQLNKFDYTLGDVQHKGRGFFYYRSPTGSWKIGHFGIGGQTAHYDFDNQLSIVYLCNGMKLGILDFVKTYNRLEQKIYEVLKNKDDITRKIK